jgi:hypothetical protein
MPRGYGRYVVLVGGDDESVRMHLRIMMTRIPIVIRRLPWDVEEAPGVSQGGGVDVGAEFMRPEVQQRRQSHEDYGGTPDKT